LGALGWAAQQPRPCLGSRCAVVDSVVVSFSRPEIFRRSWAVQHTMGGIISRSSRPMGQPAPLVGGILSRSGRLIQTTSKTHIDQEEMGKHCRDVGIPMDMLDEDGVYPPSPEQSLGGFSHDSDSLGSTPRKHSARNHTVEDADGDADSRTYHESTRCSRDTYPESYIWPEGGADDWSERGDETGGVRRTSSTLESTQVQIDGFFGQLPYKCHQNRVASVGD